MNNYEIELFLSLQKFLTLLAKMTFFFFKSCTKEQFSVLDKNIAYRFGLEYQILEFIHYLKKMYNTITKKYFQSPTTSTPSPSTIAPVPIIRVRKAESAQQCGYSRACRSPYAHSYPHNGYKWEKWTQQNCLIGIFCTIQFFW